MPFFSSTSPFDQDVEKATSENNTSEDWGLILEICDKVQTSSNGCKECLKSIIKRLNSNVPNVAMQALILLDACINNCGRPFLLEICTRDFESELKKQLSGKAHPKVADKIKELLKKWAEGEFKSDQQLSLIPSLYNKLRSEGLSFNSQEPPKKATTTLSKDPNVVNSQQEEDDIAKAIERSLKDSGGASAKTVSSPAVNSQLYPSVTSSISAVTPPTKEPKKVRAIYDFEAAEDNELTFKSGEIIHLIDDSDANWWKGSNQRGEGLFPSNFVTSDLSLEPEQPIVKVEKKSVQFNEEVQVKTVEREEPVVTEISEVKIDELLNQLHEADPTGETPDSPNLLSLEEQCLAMNPLIDQQLEKVDRKHAALTSLSRQLVDTLNMYHSLMREYSVPPHSNASYAGNYVDPQQKMIPNQQYGGYAIPQQNVRPAHSIQPPQMHNGPPQHQPYVQQSQAIPPMQQAPVAFYPQMQPDMNQAANMPPRMTHVPNPQMAGPADPRMRMPMQMADVNQIPPQAQYSSVPYAAHMYSSIQGVNNFHPNMHGPHPQQQIPDGGTYAPQQINPCLPPTSMYQQPMMNNPITNGTMPPQIQQQQQPLL